MRSSNVPTNSGSPTPRMVFVQLKIISSSDSGMPIMSQIICKGIRAATSCTKSHCFSGKRSNMRSITAAERTRTDSSSAVISFGVNPFETMERKRKCLGSSMLIMEPKNSLISCGKSPMFEPCPLQNTCGFRLTCQMSSWRVSARYPRPAGPMFSTARSSKK